MLPQVERTVFLIMTNVTRDICGTIAGVTWVWLDGKEGLESWARDGVDYMRRLRIDGGIPVSVYVVAVKTTMSFEAVRHIVQRNNEDQERTVIPDDVSGTGVIYEERLPSLELIVATGIPQPTPRVQTCACKYQVAGTSMFGKFYWTCHKRRGFFYKWATCVGENDPECPLISHAG